MPAIAIPRTISKILAVLCLVSAVNVHVGEVWAQQIEIHPTLANNLRNARIVIASGRVTAANTFQRTRQQSSSKSNNREESLLVDMQGGAPRVHYHLTIPEVKVSVELNNGNQLRIKREPNNGSAVVPLEFDQPAAGKVTVKHGAGAEEKIFQAETIWHLFMVEPEFCKTELEPLLRLLKPGWTISSTTKRIEEALLKHAATSQHHDRQAWADLVVQLGSVKYMDRVDADRKLRELGEVVVPYLRTLDSQRLDAEQAFRVRAIIRRYESEDAEDSADTAAEWLASDPAVWYSMATRVSGPQRKIIRDQLAQLLGEPVKFEVEAEGDELRAQLKQMREQVDRYRARAEAK